MESLDRQMLRYLRTLSDTEIQNRLMRLSDRDIALSVLNLEQEERDFVLSFLGRRKRQRVEEEYGYIKIKRIRYDQYRGAMQRVLETFRKGGGSDHRGYIRPIR
jgi:flagellar motor switch protein FliG